MNRHWQDSGFFLFLFSQQSLPPYPWLSYRTHLGIQRQEVVKHGYSLENEINADRKSGRSLSSLPKHRAYPLFSVQVVLAMYLECDLWRCIEIREHVFFPMGTLLDFQVGQLFAGLGCPLTAGRSVSMPAPCPPNVVLAPIHRDNAKRTRPHFQKSLPLTENHCEE